MKVFMTNDFPPLRVKGRSVGETAAVVVAESREEAREAFVKYWPEAEGRPVTLVELDVTQPTVVVLQSGAGNLSDAEIRARLAWVGWNDDDLAQEIASVRSFVDPRPVVESVPLDDGETE